MQVHCGPKILENPVLLEGPEETNLCGRQAGKESQGTIVCGKLAAPHVYIGKVAGW
jgi:hypothetical protein